MRNETIECDCCGADLSKVETPRDVYRLSLEAERIRNLSQVRYATDFPAPISGERHFCHATCLAEWLLADNVRFGLTEAGRAMLRDAQQSSPDRQQGE